MSVFLIGHLMTNLGIEFSLRQRLQSLFWSDANLTNINCQEAMPR
jgi:hypothetical protein